MAVAKTRVKISSESKYDFVDVDPRLFKCVNGDPFTFRVVPCIERQRIVQMIEAGGGQVEEDEEGPYTITLVPPAMAAFVGDDEVFGYDFIYCSCSNNELQDLNLFRVGFHSRKYKHYNAMDVLQKCLKWENVPLLLEDEDDTAAHHDGLSPPKHRLTEPASFFTTGTLHCPSVDEMDEVVDSLLSKSRKVSRVTKPDHSDVDFESVPHSLLYDHNNGLDNIEHSAKYLSEKKDSPTKSSPKTPTRSPYSRTTPSRTNETPTSAETTSPAVSPTSNKVKQSVTELRKLGMEISPISRTHTRPIYTHAERLKIIQFIIDRGAYDQVKGVKIWNQLEESCIMERRTWQSLKEHFIKKMIPNIHAYHLPSDIEDRFLEPFQNKKTRGRKLKKGEENPI